MNGMMNTMNNTKGTIRVGIDVGSTTVKLVVTDIKTKELLYSKYERHNARQIETVRRLLNEAEVRFSNMKFRAAVCGSGGKPVAEALDIDYIQEVVANAAAVKSLYPQVRTAIELGGQDAKVVFFYYDEKQKKLQTSDMRMNGSCAGGTGAFIDEIATLLGIKTEEFNELAKKGRTVYDISGRCGVFAKTDIQPLLIQGADRADIALSTFHAISRQTIGGLAQGLELKPPIIFEGGPLKFNSELVKTFAERLNLKEDEIIVPKHSETIVAYGTAVAIDELFADNESSYVTISELIDRIENVSMADIVKHSEAAAPFFADEEEHNSFEKRHDAQLGHLVEVNKTGALNVYLGIDSGSTTSKFVIIDEDENVIDRFYANNHGDPLRVVRDGLKELNKKYKEKGIQLNVIGMGTTGYGEMLLAKAFKADYHTVETVAHTYGCRKFYPDVTFLLDIGGQDMKAIWVDKGIITNICLNEACSSGCGSFLENFASTLGIKASDIAEAAFKSRNPAKLGSRCTVFMNSTIINEQREGKLPDDICAGLCRSIIENVFTKVIRINDKEKLGDKIVVQGGTFKNRAVLRALEEYLGKDVYLAPFPGEMGALGAALAAMKHIKESGYDNGRSTSFIGLDAMDTFEYTTKTGVRCEGCNNHCMRTIQTFPSGDCWITGNRCERGLLVKETTKAADMFIEREKMLFADYPYEQVSEDKNEVIGIPRVLEFWDSYPFWSTFFKALGFKVVLSSKSVGKMYEEGIQYVASDTICFPAKLVHGHIKNLADKKCDRIFFPYVMHMPPEGTDKMSPYVCSVVQGYPMVVRNSQNPEKLYKIKYDTPIFHWFSEGDRKKQIVKYAVDELKVTKQEAEKAFKQAHENINTFRNELVKKGSEIIENVRKEGKFAVVLAGRPYHTDPFICHSISKMYTSKGIPVLTVDSLSELKKVKLNKTRVEITNNFHTRMLSAAVIAAEHDELEYTQIVSFGCGHDAVLSDEIIRVMTESASKPPLVLKLDESDAKGSLNIRIQSFIETVQIRRKAQKELLKDDYSAVSDMFKSNFRGLPDPAPVKYTRKDKKLRTLLVPNISFEFSKVLSGILKKQGYYVEPIEVGGVKQIGLGKKYVHNDICFPAQMVIGELIGKLKEGNCKQSEVAVGMVKFQCDCRMSHYAALLRKGLDAAGFTEVPVVTTDVNDTKKQHPGVMLLGVSAVLEAVWSVMMLDILTDIVRKIRPYEVNKGEADRVYQECVDMIADGISMGISQAKKAFSEAVDKMASIQYDRSSLKPRVFITGELLVTYHSGSNFNIERYMESNGMEVIFPRITDQLRKDFLATMIEIKDYNANIFPYPFAVDALFDHVQKELEKTAVKHPLYKRVLRPRDMYNGVSDIIPETLSCGEGWLMAAEIAHYAKEGVRSFIILQPFGCLPNHICGRGVIKRLKDDYPDIQILPLDLDPDTSFANVENRMQMMIMNR